MIYGSRTSGLLYLSPYLVGLAVFTLFPFIASLLLSFSDYRLQDPVGAAQIIGLENYRAMLHDRTFGKSLVGDLNYVVLTVPLKLAFALFIAFVLNFKLRAIGFFRTAYYLPSILGGSVAIAVVWRYVFAGDGLVNKAIGGSARADQLARRTDERDVHHHAAAALAFGSAMVIFLAGLQGIRQDLYEAAPRRRGKPGNFRRITLPLLTPVIFFNLIMQMVQAFQEFNAPYVITGGGPLKSTYLLPLYIYDEASSTSRWATRARSRGCSSSSSPCLRASRSAHRSMGLLRAGATR